MSNVTTPLQRLQYLSQVCADFANTLPLSARGPFVDAAGEHIMALRAEFESAPTADPA
jgi:hypothetical protein